MRDRERGTQTSAPAARRNSFDFFAAPCDICSLRFFGIPFYFVASSSCFAFAFSLLRAPTSGACSAHLSKMLTSAVNLNSPNNLACMFVYQNIENTLGQVGG